MADERHSFEQARTRLAEIVTEVRKKDTSLEKSLDLLEEGVRLANICTDLVERADDGVSAARGEAPGHGDESGPATGETDGADAAREPGASEPDTE